MEISEITKECIEELYIHQNKSQTEVCSLLGLSKKKLISKIKEFDIHKPRELSSKLSVKNSTRTHESYVLGGIKSSITQKDSWNNKSNEEKSEWARKCRDAQLSMSEDAIKRKTEKAKNSYFFKSEEEISDINRRRSERLRQYWDNLSNKQQVLSDMDCKRVRTNLHRYGVPYACMREEARRYSSDSKPNLFFASLLDANEIKYEREFRLNKFSYDFKVGNILIEINPTATHNSTFNIFDREPLSKDYHYNKSKTANDNGYRCIHVFDWDNIELIINQLNKRETIFARKCEIREVDSNTAREYLNSYHLQGYCKSSINIGLFYNDMLVSIMTFGKPRYNPKYQFELLRLCSDKYVIGGSEKMFKYFIDNYSPESIISYCDFGKFNGDVYSKLGFTYVSTKIGTHWYNPIDDRHITDNLLRKLGADKLIGTNYGKGTDNEAILIANGYLAVYDAGQQTYIYKK